MDKKEALLEALESSTDYISGSELAGRLDVTRTAVWKYVKSLRADGYDIEAVTNRGYRISPDSDVITEVKLKEYLRKTNDRFSFEILPSCTSTNSVIKEKAPTLPEWHTVIASTQTAGRGRRGRSFYSPDGNGLYMSILLKPEIPAEDAVLITTAAAVAVCQAIEDNIGKEPEIKWVNDVLIGGKKVCGILTEASLDMESGGLDYAVLGVGINVTEPDGGFPPEIADIAGALLPHREHDMRCRLAASFLLRFSAIYDTFPSRSFVEEYRRRSFLIGHDILVLRQGEAIPAKALGVDESCRLIVRFGDGQVTARSSGEVSVRPAGDIS